MRAVPFALVVAPFTFIFAAVAVTRALVRETFALTRVKHSPPHAHTESVALSLVPLSRVSAAVGEGELAPAIGLAVLSFS